MPYKIFCIRIRIENIQKQALLALKLPLEQQQRCVSVNLYSVLREFYQGGEAKATPLPLEEPSKVEPEESQPETPTEEQSEAIEPITKKPKMDEAQSGREGIYDYNGY